MKTVVALGANLGDRELTFQRAIAAMAARIGPISATSRFYETEPLVLPGSAEEQPPYLNAVIALDTALPAPEVLRTLQSIERELGRDRSAELVRWGPREIDLDIVAMESLQLSEPGLTIPHPEMHKRRFVLEPMAEVDPNWVHPVLKQDVLAMLEALPPDAP